MFQHGVGVEFVRVLGETQTPALSNIFCECAPNDDVVSLAQNYITIILIVSLLWVRCVMVCKIVCFHLKFKNKNNLLPTIT